MAVPALAGPVPYCTLKFEMRSAGRTTAGVWSPDSHTVAPLEGKRCDASAVEPAFVTARFSLVLSQASHKSLVSGAPVVEVLFSSSIEIVPVLV